MRYKLVAIVHLLVGYFVRVGLALLFGWSVFKKNCAEFFKIFFWYGIEYSRGWLGGCSWDFCNECVWRNL